MTKVLTLSKTRSLILEPKPPFNFDFTVCKPSHFSAPVETWEEGRYWQSMRFIGKTLGIKLKNLGTISKPKVKLTVFSKSKISNDKIGKIAEEVRYRFEFDKDVSDFYKMYKTDKYIGKLIRKWSGAKHKGAYSIYESLMVYVCLQNAPVRRSVQMLSNLLNKYGTKIEFDGKKLYAFWAPEDLAKASEEDLRALKVGYRAKFFKRISEFFTKGEIDESKLRELPKEDAKKELLKLYGIGRQSVWYFLFEELHHYDALEKVSPWEAKLYSGALFGKFVSSEKVAKFLKQRYGQWSMLAAHIVQEDLFWRREKGEKIPWLENEIRLQPIAKSTLDILHSKFHST